MDDQFQNGYSPVGGNDDGFGGGFLGGDSLGSYDGGFGTQPSGDPSFQPQNPPGYGQSDYNSGTSGIGGTSNFGQSDYNSGTSGIGGTSSFGQSDYNSGTSGIGGTSNFGQSDYSTGTSGIGGTSNFGQSDYNSGTSGIGGTSSFGQSDYNSGTSGIGGTSNFGQSDFNSGSGIGGGIGGNSGIGGSSFDQAPEPYDPNFMFSDPSSGYGGGSDPAFSSMNSASRVNTVTLPAQNKNKTVIAAILLLVIGVGIAVGVYIMNNQKKSFRDWSNTAEGKSFVAQMQKIADTEYQSNEYNISVFVEGDDKLIIELTMTEYAELTDEQIDFVKSYTESAMAKQKVEIAQDIRKIQKQEKLNDFMIVYRMTNADGTKLYDIEIKG